MKTPISHYGGKQTLLEYILPLIPKHKLYIEAFCSGTAALFTKRPTDDEVINNISMDITDFYWMVRVYYRGLRQKIEKTLHSRNMRARAGYILQYPRFFQPVQRARAVWTLHKVSFVDMMGGSFGYDFGGGVLKRLRNAENEFMEWLCARLDNVVIENRDVLDVISTYDSPGTFHFVDPLYINSDYGHCEGTFDEYCMERLLQLLGQMKGKFMLTMLPLPIVEKYTDKSGWIIHRVERTIGTSKAS